MLCRHLLVWEVWLMKGVCYSPAVIDSPLFPAHLLGCLSGHDTIKRNCLMIVITAFSLLDYPGAGEMVSMTYSYRRNSVTASFYMWILNVLYFFKIQITFFLLSKWSNLINVIHFPLLPNIAESKVLLREPPPPHNIYTYKCKINRAVQSLLTKIALRNVFLLWKMAK